MLTRISAEIPHYATLDPASLAGVRDIAVAYVGGCLRAAQERRGPTAAELEMFAASARLRARAGWPLGAILHAYRLGVGAWWDVVRSEVGHQPEDLDTVVELVAGLMRYLDEVQSTVAENYLDEAEQLAADEDRSHHRVIQAVIEAGGRSQDADLLADRAQVELADAYVVVVLVDVRNPRAHARLANELRSLDTALSVLAAPRTSDVLALWPDGADAGPQRDAVLRRLSAGRQVAIAIGVPTNGGYAAALVEAEQVLAITGSSGGVHRLEDVPLQALVRQVGGRTTEVLGRLLDPVVAQEGAGSADLLQTLQVFLARDGSVRRTAEALHVHPNTVTYRLERIRLLTGADPRRLRDALLLLAALELRYTSSRERGS
jgi:hypothetical protein